MINNHDDISGLISGYGTGAKAGRWALGFLGDFVEQRLMIGSFNIPIFDGMLALFFYTLAVCVILSLFNLQQDVLGRLFAAVFVTYPACAGTLLYMYTAAYYGAACLLAVLAVYFLKCKNLPGGILSVFCIAFSLGIYQAYFPMTVTLCVLLLLEETLSKENVSTEIKTGLYYASVIIIGLVLYFLTLKWTLWKKGMELTPYQSINTMGEIKLQELPGLIGKCYCLLWTLIQKAYCSINTLPITRICFLIVFVVSLLTMIMLIGRQKRRSTQALTLSLFCILPIGMNLIEIMCNKSMIYELMVYSTVLLFFIPIVLIKRLNSAILIRKLSEWAITVILIAAALGYSWHANWNYTALSFMNRQSESYMTTLITRIKSAEGYRDEYPVMFAGARKFSDEQFTNMYTVYSDLYFDGNPRDSLVNLWTWKEAIHAYTGFTFVEPTGEEQESVINSEEYQEMSVYPDDGSIKVINNVLVIRISDL